jgi:hypothetical protein
MATDQVRTSDPKLAAGYDSVINKIADTISNSPEIQQLAMAHPNAGADFGRALNIAGTAELGGDGETPAEKPATEEGTTTPPKEVANEDVTPPSGGEPALSPDIIASRLDDATPSYHKSMIGKYVMTADSLDEDGNLVKGSLTPRIASEGTGLNGLRPVTRSASETAAGTELKNVPDYPDNGTNLEKGLAVQKEISTEAENMRSGLQKEDQENPLDTESQRVKVNNIIKANLPPELQKLLGVLSPEHEAFLRGMYEKSGVPIPEGGIDVNLPNEKSVVPKTAANRYFQDVSDAASEYDGSREGLLDLRQKVDSLFDKHGGKYAFGTDSQNALAESHADIRDALNKELHDNVTDTDVKASLKKQTNLYRARDVLNAKAQAEDPTQFGRAQQKFPVLRILQRIFLRKGINSAI